MTQRTIAALPICALWATNVDEDELMFGFVVYVSWELGGKEPRDGWLQQKTKLALNALKGVEKVLSL